jgi:hypothetical protein
MLFDRILPHPIVMPAQAGIHYTPPSLIQQQARRACLDAVFDSCNRPRLEGRGDGYSEDID